MILRKLDVRKEQHGGMKRLNKQLRERKKPVWGCCRADSFSMNTGLGSMKQQKWFDLVKLGVRKADKWKPASMTIGSSFENKSGL